MASRRNIILAVIVALAGPAACVSPDLIGLSIPIPGGSTAYLMEDTLLSYHYIDTTQGRSSELWWVPQNGFEGFNCLALLPNTPTDTVGSFVFAFQGANKGVLRQRTFIDTVFVAGYFLPQLVQGSHGQYVVDSAGHLKLTWADGNATQYFDPTADLELHGDTITSHAELSAHADSVHASWSVTWVRNLCR